MLNPPRLMSMQERHFARPVFNMKPCCSLFHWRRSAPPCKQPWTRIRPATLQKRIVTGSDTVYACWLGLHPPGQVDQALIEACDSARDGLHEACQHIRKKPKST